MKWVVKRLLWLCKDLSREYWIIYREPGFQAVVWIGFPTSSPVSKHDSQEDWERETTCWWERGRGRNQIIRRRASLALWIYQQNELYPIWCILSDQQRRESLFRTGTMFGSFLCTAWVIHTKLCMIFLCYLSVVQRRRETGQESIERLIEGQAFLQSYDSASRPPSLSPQ